MLQKKAEDLTAEDDIEDRARPDNKKWQESAQIKETVLAHEEQQMWRKLSMVWKGEHTIISAKSLEYFEPFTVGVLSNIVSHCGTSRVSCGCLQGYDVRTIRPMAWLET
jgi:hypothetical protein